MNATRPGNDMRGLPTGDQVFKISSLKSSILKQNGRKAVIGISYEKGFPGKAEVPVNEVAKCVYLLHSSSDNIPSTFAGAITFRYMLMAQKNQETSSNSRMSQTGGSPP